MESVFNFIVSWFQKIVTIDFFKHCIMMCVFVWLFALVYSFGSKK